MANSNVELLLELQRRVLAERSRVIGGLAGLAAGEALPGEALHQLSVLHGAAVAIGEEIETHTPKIGHGGES